MVLIKSLVYGLILGIALHMLLELFKRERLKLPKALRSFEQDIFDWADEILMAMPRSGLKSSLANIILARIEQADSKLAEKAVEYVERNFLPSVFLEKKQKCLDFDEIGVERNDFSIHD